MADIKLVIRISEELYKDIQSRDWKNGGRWFSEEWKAIHNGTSLPKGHGRLIDADAIPEQIELKGFLEQDNAHLVTIDRVKETLNNAPTIIEADKKYKAEVIIRGNCMMCGKELTEGLFFCKECESKASSRKRGM